MFTGSTEVGKYFMQYSAQSNLKQVWLECGGKGANLVFADCQDLGLAAQKAAFGIFFNQGEVCSANSRLLVQRSIHDEFVEASKPRPSAGNRAILWTRRALPAPSSTAARRHAS